MGTYDGLGVPLNGAYTSYQSDGTTSYLAVDALGMHNFTFTDEGADNFISVSIVDTTTVSSGYTQAFYAKLTSSGSKSGAQTGSQQNVFATDIILSGTQTGWVNGMFVYIAESGTATITGGTIDGYTVYLAAFGQSPADRHGFHVFSGETSTITDATAVDAAFFAEGAGSGTFGSLLAHAGSVLPHFFLDVHDTTDITTRMVVDYSASTSASKALRVKVGSAVYNVPMVADSCS